MRFLSLFAGIGGFDLGLERAGMTCVGQCEIDPFCQKVLAKDWPNVARFEDVRTIKFDTSAKALYDSRYGTSEEQLSRSRESLQGGVVAGRDCVILRENSTGRVGVDESEGNQDASAEATRNGESLPPRRGDGKRQGAKHFGKGDRSGSDQEAESLPGVRGIPEIQGRAKRDSGASSRLQQAAGCNVALPEVSSRMAQEKSSNRKEGISGSRQQIYHGSIDLIAGGFP